MHGKLRQSEDEFQDLTKTRPVVFSVCPTLSFELTDQDLLRVYGSWPIRRLGLKVEVIGQGHGSKRGRCNTSSEGNSSRTSGSIGSSGGGCIILSLQSQPQANNQQCAQQHLSADCCRLHGSVGLLAAIKQVNR